MNDDFFPDRQYFPDSQWGVITLVLVLELRQIISISFPDCQWGVIFPLYLGPIAGLMVGMPSSLKNCPTYAQETFLNSAEDSKPLII